MKITRKKWLTERDGKWGIERDGSRLSARQMAGTPKGVFLRSTKAKKKTKLSVWKKNVQATSKATKTQRNREKAPKKKGKGKGERQNENDREDNFSHRLPGRKNEEQAEKEGLPTKCGPKCLRLQRKLRVFKKERRRRQFGVGSRWLARRWGTGRNIMKWSILNDTAKFSLGHTVHIPR